MSGAVAQCRDAMSEALMGNMKVKGRQGLQKLMAVSQQLRNLKQITHYGRAAWMRRKEAYAFHRWCRTLQADKHQWLLMKQAVASQTSQATHRAWKLWNEVLKIAGILEKGMKTNQCRRCKTALSMWR